MGPGAAPLLALTIGAILLRLLLFLGRGHYVAFDEGWYLLLGQNLWSGAGYTLSGLQHVALSPLFPILAGALDLVTGDIVWAGRIVAAVASGLLVVPCWFLFHRMGGRTVAIIGGLLVAVLPSLSPFVAPFWIGWDLWVGAEPLLHLFLFAGCALFLHAWERQNRWTALACGGAFALAYLARPEAIVAFGLLGLVALVAAVRTLRSRWPLFLLCGLAFVLVATPYWLYLREEVGRWTVTGRGVAVAPTPRTGTAGGGAARSIEDMLWQDDESAYIRRLYGLNAEGTELVSHYWGVRRVDGTPTAVPTAAPAPAARPAPPDSAGAPTARSGAGADPGRGTAGVLHGIVLYVRALAVVVPWYAWLFVALGVFARAPARRPRLEALIAVPLIGTSAFIAAVVAIDPRTQLFLAPVAAYYAALGAAAAGRALEMRTDIGLRPGFGSMLTAGVLALLLLGTSARRLYLSLAVGSPHHIVGAENAAVGQALHQRLEPDAAVMSWHPAVALYARRDWRVLPLEPMDRIIGYAQAQAIPYMVLSVFYPPDLLDEEGPHYLIVRMPDPDAAARQWRLQMRESEPPWALGELRPVE